MKVLWSSFVLILVLTACGKSSGQQQSVPQSSPTPSVSSVPFMRRNLFESQLTAQERAQNRREFLTSQYLLNEGAAQGLFRYSINSERGPQGLPKTPVVHSYHILAVSAPLVVKFSSDFFQNIPEPIQSQLNQYALEELDLFFTPQLAVRTEDASLKPAFWMYPNRPEMDEVVGSPPEFDKRVLLGLHASDYDINSNHINERGVNVGVVADELRLFHCFMHHGRISPDTGYLNIHSIPDHNVSFSFYSIAVFEEQRRAAVTLHWMLTPEDRDALVQDLQVVSGSDANHLNRLIERLSGQDHPFHGTPMLQKLQNLTSIL
jgi:hypothetical protein